MPFNTRTMVREYAGGSVGGILRKGGGTSNSGASSASTVAGIAHSGETRQVDLLVFGYACKVFRDDAKAREIDQGKHMIPWMGDSSLKIDRYDVRGALYDLAPHEPPPGGYGNRLDYLSAEEQRAEQLCEEERYLYLYNSEEEHILQQEEDLKRLKQESEGGTYTQVGFQYDGEAALASGGVLLGPNREDYTDSPTCDDADQVFSLPQNFEVPINIQLPETMKQHAIIEKTARFIASQGVQMEILLKAKQSNNVQFEFLTQNSALNPYYKFIMNAIKDGTYPSEESLMKASPNIESAAVAEAVSNDAVDSLNVVAKPVITVPTIKYKPSPNCAYTQLISKIKGVPIPDVLDESAAVAGVKPDSGADSPSIAALHSTNGVDSFTPVLLQYNGSTFVTADVEDTNSNSNSNSNIAGQTSTSAQNVQPQVEILKNTSALALAQDYSSGSESDDEEEASKPKPEPVLNFPIPTDVVRSIIDKTATYVIKNGRQFEETLRAKIDERFAFLIPDNEYYAYYLYKITGDPDAASREQKTRKAAAVAAALLSKKGLLSSDKTLAPVSFSIKAKDETVSTSLPPALPQEASDDDEDKKEAATTQTTRSVPEHVQKAIQLVEGQLMARNAQLAAAAASGIGTLLSSRSSTSTSSTVSRFDIDCNTTMSGVIGGGGNRALVKSTKAEMERNALFEQQQQNRQKELRKAEEKVKDKLAQIAREKLGGLISREKQLQLERKRKAMAFLNQIKGDPATDAAESNEPTEKKDKAKTDDENASDDSDVSVHSIPITCYGPDVATDEEEDSAHIQAKTPPPPPFPKQINMPAKSKINATVTVSDDDDVQLVSETRLEPCWSHYKTNLKRTRTERRSRSRSPLRSNKRRMHQYSSDLATSSSTTTDDDDCTITNHRVSSKKHAHKTSKSKKSSKSHQGKKKPKKRRTHSRSRSRSVSHRHRSHSRSSYFTTATTTSRTHYSLSCTPESEEMSDDPSFSNRHRSRSHHKRSSHASTPPPKTREKRKKPRY